MSIKDYITQSILSKLYKKDNEPILKVIEKPNIKEDDGKSVFELEKRVTFNDSFGHLGKHANSKVTSEIMQIINLPSLGCDPKAVPILSEYISGTLGINKYTSSSDFFQMSIRNSGRHIQIEHDEQLINIAVNQYTGEIFAKHKNTSYISPEGVTEPSVFLKTSNKPYYFRSSLQLKQHNDGTLNVIQNSSTFSNNKQNVCSIQTDVNGYIVLGEEDGQLITTSSTQPKTLTYSFEQDDTNLWHDINKHLSQVTLQRDLLSRNLESEVIFEQGTKIATPEQKPFKNFIVDKYAKDFVKTTVENEFLGQPEEVIAEKIEDALEDYKNEEDVKSFYNRMLRRNFEQKALSEEGKQLVSLGQYGILTRALFNPTYTSKAVVEKQMTPLVKNLCNGYQTEDGSCLKDIVVTSFSNEQCATFKSTLKDNVTIITSEEEQPAFDSLKQDYSGSKTTYSASMVNNSFNDLLNDNVTNSTINSPSATVTADVKISSWFKTKYNEPTYISSSRETYIAKNEDYEYTSDYINQENNATPYYLENKDTVRTLGSDGRVLSYDSTAYSTVKNEFSVNPLDETSLLFDISKVQTQATTQVTPVE